MEGAGYVSEVQDLGILLRLGLFRCSLSLGPVASVCPASGWSRAIHREDADAAVVKPQW